MTGTTPFYCDPPYYQTEGITVEFKKEDHATAGYAGHCKGKWLVSYNDCEYIREHKGYTSKRPALYLLEI